MYCIFPVFLLMSFNHLSHLEMILHLVFFPLWWILIICKLRVLNFSSELSSWLNALLQCLQSSIAVKNTGQIQGKNVGLGFFWLVILSTFSKYYLLSDCFKIDFQLHVGFAKSRWNIWNNWKVSNVFMWIPLYRVM